MMDYSEINTKVTGFRRRLHRIPELDRDLPKTKAFLLAYLNTLSCEIEEVGEDSEDSPGFVAYFKGGKARQGAGAIAFRADMDALPVTEKNDIDYCSEHEGCMHACGHDGHMAILLGLATILDVQIEQLTKNVLLVFQASEETRGGAEDLIKAGLFRKYDVKKIFGLHIWPGYSKNTIVSRCGEFMASTMPFHVDIKGKQAHVGVYKTGVDAMLAGCRFVDRVYEMEEKAFSEDVFRLLRFGEFISGTAVNVVAGSARIGGTLRTYDNEVHETLMKGMKKIAADINKESSASFSFDCQKSFPAVINPQKLYDESIRKLKNAGFEYEELPEPILMGEDFSCYQQNMPGLFIYLCTGLKEPLHSDTYQIDEEVLATGVRAFAVLLGLEG